MRCRPRLAHRMADAIPARRVGEGLDYIKTCGTKRSHEDLGGRWDCQGPPLRHDVAVLYLAERGAGGVPTARLTSSRPPAGRRRCQR